MKKMMKSLLPLIVLVALLVIGGCENLPTEPTEPKDPQPVEPIEKVSGTLMINYKGEADTVYYRLNTANFKTIEGKLAKGEFLTQKNLESGASISVWNQYGEFFGRPIFFTADTLTRSWDVYLPIPTVDPDTTGTMKIAVNKPDSVTVVVSSMTNNSVVWTGLVTRAEPVTLDSLKGTYNIYCAPENHDIHSENRTFGPGNWHQEVRIDLNCQTPENPPTPPTPTTKTFIVSWDINPDEATVMFDGALYSTRESVEVDSSSDHTLQASFGPCYSYFDLSFTADKDKHFDIQLDFIFFLSSDGRYLYTTKYVVDGYGFMGFQFDGSGHVMHSAPFSEMDVVDGLYRFDLNTLPYRDYTLVTMYKQGNWYSTDLHCTPEMTGTWLEGNEWFGFDWNNRQIEPTPEPTVDRFWVNVQVCNNAPFDVFINDKDHSYGEGVIEVCTGGNHTVTVKKEGFYPETKPFFAAANDTPLVKFCLEEIPDEIPAPHITFSIGEVHGSWEERNIINNSTGVVTTYSWKLNGVDVNWGQNPGHKVFPVGLNKIELYGVGPGGSGYEAHTFTVIKPTPPPTNPLRIEVYGNSIRLYGDGHGEWMGLETYDPDQESYDPDEDGNINWTPNLWVRGTYQTEYTEWEIPIDEFGNARWNHVVIWHDCTPGLQGLGGSGTYPRFSDWANLIAGNGISHINTNPGYFVYN